MNIQYTPTHDYPWSKNFASWCECFLVSIDGVDIYKAKEDYYDVSWRYAVVTSSLIGPYIQELATAWTIPSNFRNSSWIKALKLPDHTLDYLETLINMTS